MKLDSVAVLFPYGALRIAFLRSSRFLKDVFAFLGVKEDSPPFFRRASLSVFFIVFL